jgi:hypothetical protein
MSVGTKDGTVCLEECGQQIAGVQSRKVRQHMGLDTEVRMEYYFRLTELAAVGNPLLYSECLCAP